MEQFARTELLISKAGLAKLQQQRVAVVGLGGVGSYAAEALVRSGIGELVLIDFDRITKTNINRQLHALESTLGRPKVAVLAERFREINPQIKLHTHQEICTSANQARLLGEVDYVIDAIDMVTAKVELLTYCYYQQIPALGAMGTGNKLDPLQFQLTDISKTHTDPLAKVVRRLLRERGITKGVKVLFSPEKPINVREKLPVDVDLDNLEKKGNRIAPGSIAFVPAVAGLTMASWVVRQLLAGKADGQK